MCFCDYVNLVNCDFSIDLKLKQGGNIKFFVKLGKTATQTLERLQQTDDNEAMSQAGCFEWHLGVKRGRTLLEDDERSGRPSTSTIREKSEKIERIVHQNRRVTISEIADVVNVSFGSVQAILMSDLNMHRVAAKFVPRLLTLEWKQHRVEVCEDLVQHARVHPIFMSRMITGDDSWVYGYDPETKQQSSEFKSPQSPRSKKPQQVRNTTKSILVGCFLTFAVSCTVNSSPRVRLSMPNSTVPF